MMEETMCRTGAVSETMPSRDEWEIHPHVISELHLFTTLEGGLKLFLTSPECLVRFHPVAREGERTTPSDHQSLSLYAKHPYCSPFPLCLLRYAELLPQNLCKSLYLQRKEDGRPAEAERERGGLGDGNEFS
jgi:hypothetical protein